MAFMYSVRLNNSSTYFSICSSIALGHCGVKGPPCALNVPGQCPQIFHVGIVHLC